MLKNLCELSHQIDNKVCRLIMDNDTPLVIIKESLFQFQKYIGIVEEQVLAKQKAQEEDNKPVVESKVEELPVEV